MLVVHYGQFLKLSFAVRLKKKILFLDCNIFIYFILGSDYEKKTSEKNIRHDSGSL